MFTSFRKIIGSRPTANDDSKLLRSVLGNYSIAIEDEKILMNLYKNTREESEIFSCFFSTRDKTIPRYQKAKTEAGDHPSIKRTVILKQWSTSACDNEFIYLFFNGQSFPKADML